MTRRSFLPAAAGSALAGTAGAADSPQPAIFEIGIARLRNSSDNERERVVNHWKNAVMPALQRAGAGPIGVFGSSIGPDSPYILTLTQYASMAAYGETASKLMGDKEYIEAAVAFDQQGGRNYERVENSLLRGFRTMPRIVIPEGAGKRAPKVFELRTYESNNFSTLRRKVKMFDDGEIGIFQRLGMSPVFFGQTIVGRNMPNLVYMLGFDSMAHRDKAWGEFGRDPEWAKLRAMPGLSDAEVVSNISNVILSPLPFSQIS